MRKCTVWPWFLTIIIILILSAPLVWAEEDYSNEPWEKAALYLGAFIVSADTDLKLGGGGLDVNIDGEEILGLDDLYTTFRGDLIWRITRRNRVDFTYWASHRDGTEALIIDIPDPDGGSFPIGQVVDTKFDIDILRGSYAWSFFKNEHFDLGIAAGLYGMKLDFELKTEGVVGGAREKTDFAFPLPVLGLRGTFALSDKWFIRQQFDYFYVNIADYEGQLLDFLVAVEWNALKYLGLGVGYNYVQMDLEYSGSDDFLSEFDLRYGGLLAFAKIYF
jgi:hypothetical protein